MVVMCDSKNLNWCGRITLLLSICGVLCVMMFQIWSYYFSLVSQMDDMVMESPSVQGVVEFCEGQVQRAWNIEDCAVRGARVVCELADEYGIYFLDSVGLMNASVNASQLSFSSTGACGRVMLWILPW